jgi:hypothetical protein
VQLLRALARERGIEFPEGSVPVENTSYETRDDINWVHADDQVGALLLDSVREDQKLYGWALKRFEILESEMSQADLTRSRFRQFWKAFRAGAF